MDERLQVYEDKMSKTMHNLGEEYGGIRAGRANPHVLDKLRVDYYGTPTPIQQVANVNVPEPRMIQIQPWEASMVKEIEKAILTSDLGINPTNDGKVIRLVFPELTEERRKELAKDVLQETYYVAYKKWDILCEHSNPMGWLINTAKNKIRELNKSLKKIECEVGLDADEYTFTEDGYGKSELDLVITKGLTEEEKNRFYKYFLHGYSISELAQLEKISENNMSVRISRLRSKIAQNIPDESGIDKKYKKSVRIDKKESCT